MRDIFHALVLEMHQPSENLSELLESDPWEAKQVLFAYDRIPRELWQYEDLARINLTISGTLLESLSNSDFQRRVYGIVDCGTLLWALQNTRIFEILGTAYYHPTMALIPEDDWDQQIVRWQGIARHLFWRSQFPGFWPPDIGFDRRLIPHLVRAGYRYVIVDSEFVDPVGEMSWQELRYRPHYCAYGDAEIIVIVRDRDLSDAQLAGMDYDWFYHEVRERTKWCDFPPLVTTATGAENGGWFRNVGQQANFPTLFYKKTLEEIRAGRSCLRPTFITEYLSRFGAHGHVTIRRGAWNTDNHHGWNFDQWQGGQAQRDTMARVHRVSREFHRVAELADTWQGASELKRELARVLNEAQWRLLRAETSDHFFWGDAWLHKAHNDLDDAEWHLGEARAILRQPTSYEGPVRPAEQPGPDQPQATVTVPGEAERPSALSALWPIALLPVRLETRFREGELWIRIYPDDIHIDSHEPALTRAEITGGKRYWEDVWRSGGVADREAAAWERLAAQCGAPRAAWVARVLQPSEEGRPQAPTEEGAPLSVAPSFPDVEEKAGAWTRAPVARALPTRWHAIGVLDEENTVGISEPIADAPAVWFHPTAAAGQGEDASPGVGDDEPPVDPAMRWMVDFDAACAIGMALKLPLTERMVQGGLDRLIVFGIAETLDPAAGERELGNLFESHYHTRGFAYLPQGTPTNNTDQVRSGYAPSAPQTIRNMRVTHGEEAPTNAQSNAHVLARALGFSLEPSSGALIEGVRRGGAADSPGALSRAAGGDLREQASARTMNTALWAATWGYFLWRMLLPALSQQAITFGRRHFIDHVRAAGPLPALRVGSQPYGVLPVMALDQGGTGEDDFDRELIAFLRRIRDLIWLPASEAVPCVDGQGTDATEEGTDANGEGTDATKEGTNAIETLLRVLSMSANSSEISARSVLGTEYVTYLWRFGLGAEPPRVRLNSQWQEDHAEALRALLGRLGLAWDPRVARMIFAAGSFRLQSPLPEEVAGLLPAALQWLAHPPVTEAADPMRLDPVLETLLGDAVECWRIACGNSRSESPAVPPLLFLLLRHALLIEYAFAAFRYQVANAIPSEEISEEPELIDIFPGRVDWPLRRQLLRILPGGERPLGNHLHYATPEQEPLVADLVSFRQAVAELADCPGDVLQRLTRQTLDLASSRLDAWITSFATKSLAELRRENPRGILLGGYGWLVKLQPRSESSESNAGYIHAPSLPQAVTAAVLRSGWRAHADGTRSLLDVNVSSRRARVARWLLDGARNGQSLSALLGYRFERSLQEYQQEHPQALVLRHLARLRRLAPVVGRPLQRGGAATEVVVATNVVDGLELHRLRRGDSSATNPSRKSEFDEFLRNLPGPEDGAGERQGILRALEALDDAIDAVNDALVCESVHQAVQGRPLKAGAVLDSAAWGESPPPELEFLRTPRTGIGITHRILITTNLSSPELDNWPIDIYQARARAEPALNALAAQLLVPPRRVAYRAMWDTPEGIIATERRLDALFCSPVDYIYIVDDFSENPQGSEFYRRLLEAALTAAPPSVPTNARPRLAFERDVSWEADVLSVSEFAEMVRVARELLLSGTPMSEAHLALPGNVPEVRDDDEALTSLGANTLKIRADEALAGLSSITPALRGDNANVAAALVRASAYGMFGAFPSGTIVPSQIAAVRAEVERRVEACNNLTRVFDRDRASPRERRDHDIARLQQLLGEDFRVLPPFAPLNDQLRISVAASESLQDGDRRAADTWLQRLSRVRVGAGNLHAARTYAEVVAGTSIDLVVAQLPCEPGDRWVGLARKGDGSDVRGSRLSLILAGTRLNVSQSMAGILVDESTQIIPAANETTGIAFHFDAPNSRPPQSILLAVAPHGESSWTPATLHATLEEVLDLLKVRAVDVDILSNLSGNLSRLSDLLPACYFSLNVDGDTASTDFTLSANTPQ